MSTTLLEQYDVKITDQMCTDPIGPDDTIRPGREQMSANLGGETAILNLEQGMYFGLDGAGSRIWELIQGEPTLREVCDALCGEYEVDAAECEADIAAFLREMERAGLVEIIPKGSIVR